MWMACSPGGRFFTLSWISTPDPVALITAEPALSPAPFLSSTLTVFPELDSDRVATTNGRTNTAKVLRFMPTVYDRVEKKSTALEFPRRTSTFPLIFPALFLNVDPQLFGLLVEMATLQAESPGSLGNLVTRTFQFGKYGLSLKALYPLRQRSRSHVRWSVRHRQHQVNRRSTDAFVVCQQHQPFHYIAQFTNVPWPGMV